MSFGLDAAISALAAARLGIETAGNNVANAATPGYSRQRILLSSALPATVNGRFQLGTGVNVNGIFSAVDDGLELQLRMQIAASGRAGVDVRRWNEIEGLLNEPGGGLGSNLSDLFAKVGDLQTDASDLGLRNGLIQSAKGLTGNLNLLADRISATRNSSFAQVDSLTRQVSDHARAIADLNRQILALESNGSRANDLRDSREQRIKQIASIVEVRAIERTNGAVDVSVDGRVLVSGTRADRLRAGMDSSGNTQILLGKSTAPLTPESGQLAGLLYHESAGATEVLEQLDRLAFNMALEFNRVHSTGVPRSGSFQSLTSFYGAQDTDGDGQRGDELLGQADLPFEVGNGELYVTVSDLGSGQIERTRIAIDPASMSLDDLAAELSQIQHLSASVDPNGRLRVAADGGYGFDFGNRLQPLPDAFGSFGGASPSIAASNAGPFDLSGTLASPPATFTVQIDGSPRVISLDGSEFQNPAAATVDELVSAINADLGSGGTAASVGGRLVIRSNSAGASATLGLTDGTGSPLATLGLATGVTRSGQDQGVAPKISGEYTGSTNGSLRFVPDGDGDIGVTPGLTVSVYDQNGAKLATLNVGDTYSPDSELDVVDGVVVSFGPGSVSATFNDSFELATIADSDTSDILVAVGLNSFFHGTTAADLAVNKSLEQNPGLLAASLSGAAGDADNLGRLVDLRNSELTSLDQQSIEDFYSAVVGDVGFESASSQATLEAQDSLLLNLQQQRDAVSGVNIDEEMLDLVRFQQAFEAASRFVSVVNDLTQTLVNLGR